MKLILTTAAVILILVLVLQTRESAMANKISVVCEAAEVESAECMSFGPLGALNRSGIRFWATTFVHHGIELPQVLRDSLRDKAEWI